MRPSGIDRLRGARTLRPLVHLSRRLHLRRGQARGVVAAAVRTVAQQPGGIEGAAARIVDEAVFEPVDRITRLDRRPRQQRQLGGRNDRRAVASVGGHPRVEESEGLADPVVRRIAGDDAVVVVGKALRLGERLMPAARAADEVRVIGKAAGMVAHDQPGGFGHHVNRAIGPVDNLLGMALTELHVVAGVAGIGAGGGVAAAERGRQRGVADRARIAAVADALELAVPRIGRRHPQLELDLGVGGRARDRLNAAERRQRDFLARSRHDERTRRHCRGGANADGRNRQRGEILAGRPIRGQRRGTEGRGNREHERGHDAANHERLRSAAHYRSLRRRCCFLRRRCCFLAQTVLPSTFRNSG